MTAVRVEPSAIVSVTVHLPDKSNLKDCAPVPVRLSVVAAPFGDVNTTVAAFAASQVTKLFSEKNGKQQIYRSIISKYGQEQGLKIYREIKKLL